MCREIGALFCISSFSVFLSFFLFHIQLQMMSAFQKMHVISTKFGENSYLFSLYWNYPIFRKGDICEII